MISARGSSNIAFITDSISEPIPEKKVIYNLERPARVSKDAKYVECVEKDGSTTLVGSCVQMIDIFRHCI